MLPINRAIEYANALGLVPGPSGSTQMIHIGASFYYMPCADIYVRKEDKEFVIYNSDGLVKDRVRKLAAARMYGCTSGLSVTPQESAHTGSTSQTRKVYCDKWDGDGKVVIDLDSSDNKLWAERRQDEVDLPENEFGVWLAVTDQNTDKIYEIRTAPCGAGCRCAAEAREVRD